ncbi:nucleotidyltransferase family protein [Peribacillus butanolivorans]|uniref:nucleotidyltransferase domain-containing protein n=1 Tax=Peribacillus butanolivorans TaxID=421767 RepID=UPI003D2B31C2
MDNKFSLNLKHISKELRLIFEIIKKRNDDRIILNEYFINIDWKYFLQLVNHHRVYPLIYLTLNKIENKLIPPHVIQTLYKEYRRNTLKMLQLSGEMEIISKLFAENKIRLLFLKGPVIAAELYDDISLRTSKDLDIIIPLSVLEKAEALLISFGYVREEENPTLLNEQKWRYYHVTYFHPIKGVQIEIHWRLEPRPSKEPCFNDLWERKRVSILTSYPVNFLGKEDLFFYLTTHGARHGWFRLRWLVDIDQMVRKGLCIRETNLSLKKYKYHHIAGQALILTSQLLNSPINEEMKFLTERSHSKKLAQSSILFIREMASLDIIMSNNYYKHYRLSLKSNLQKFLSFLILFYPVYTDTEILKLPKHFHFLYFPLRPFLWAWRKTKKTA